ncbi:MAG TPA: class II fumarate hydratase [Chthoniobacteraceae bacterium]|jgi:fumarate hydratase class II|nr:class II fumarate hydratase [Chthoniobacteraceae bacterium]
MSPTRTEKDSMGTMEVPADALYGASTQRAVLNFPVSGHGFGREFIRALGMIKWAAAEANLELGRLDEERTTLIARAAEEIIAGKLDAHFPIDIYQTGSGTSTNMNINEVLANRCSQLAGKAVGSKEPVHPNDHVNMGQSSNDVIPTAIHVAVGERLRKYLIPALEELRGALERKSMEFWNVIKIGRTHLMDATPVRLGQEFGGYAKQIEHSVLRAGNAIAAIEELPIGGTAVGTGLNCHPDFAGIVVRHLENQTGIAWHEARNHFEAQSAKDGLVQASGQLKTIAVSLFKIANDIRWLSSGPRCGIGEITLPETQPGSSIMPGKVNPVICESVMQVCARVIGNDATVTWCAANSNFELNTMMPALAESLLESCRLLANVTRIFTEKCVSGIKANVERCNELVEYSMAMVTSLAPIIGYDKAAEIAKESAKSGRTVREICRELQILPEDELNKALDPFEMTKPGGEGSSGG